MRRLTALALVYVLACGLVLPTSLFAGELPVPDGTAAPAAPAAPEPVTTEPAPAPAPEPAAPAPEPAPAPDPAPAPAPAAPAVQDLGKEEAPKPPPKAVAAASATVTISDFQFSPGTVTVNQGDTVTWTNEGPTPHSATASDGSFDTGVYGAGESRSQTFDQAGTFAYICTPHPNMQGTVVVQAASNQGGSDDTGTGADDTTGGTGGTGGTATDTDDGPSLPATGMDAAALALLGLVMLALGVGVRRRSAFEVPQHAGRIGW
jgi:LPXTG-motif cell wall-anchored protein